MTPKSKTMLGFLYAVALAVILSGASLSAAWPHGCCNGSSQCGDTKICCVRPDGWAPCYVPEWWWQEHFSNYCNYDTCNLEQND